LFKQPWGIRGPSPVGRLWRIDGVREVEALIRATLFKD